MGIATGILLLIVGAVGVKYGITAILMGLSAILIGLGLKSGGD